MPIITAIKDAEVDITNKVIGWLNATPSVISEYENSKYTYYLVVTQLLFFTQTKLLKYFFRRYFIIGNHTFKQIK